MPQSSKRMRRVADLIQHQIAQLIQLKVRDPRLSTMTITAVHVAPDLRFAKIYFTLLDAKEKDSALLALKKATGYLRHLLAEESALRYVPNLLFAYDSSIDLGNKLSKLIDEAASHGNATHDKKESDDEGSSK